MQNAAKTGVPIIGVVFLLLAVMKFINGESWIVWAILGFLFGGFSIFSAKQPGGGGGA